MKQFLDTVLTLIGDYHDPSIRLHVDFLVVELLKILAIGKNEFRVKTVEPWNSVRVTFNIPRNAALRLRQLAISSQERCVLRDLGILTVQIQGENAIPISHVTGGDATSQRSDSFNQSYTEHFNQDNIASFRNDISISQVINLDKNVIHYNYDNPINSPVNNNVIDKSIHARQPLYYKTSMQGVSNSISNHTIYGNNNYINFHNQENYSIQPSISPINNIQLDNSYMTHDIIDAVGLHDLKDLKELAPSDIINEVDSSDNFNMNNYIDERILSGASKVQSNAYLSNPFNNPYEGRKFEISSENKNLQINNNYSHHNSTSNFSGNSSHMLRSNSNHNIPFDKFINHKFVAMDNSYDYNLNFTKLSSQNVYYQPNPLVLTNKCTGNLISDITSQELSQIRFTKNDSTYESPFVTSNFSYNLSGSQFSYNPYVNSNNHAICRDMDYNAPNRTPNYLNSFNLAKRPTNLTPAFKENLSIDAFTSTSLLPNKISADYNQYLSFHQSNPAKSISIPSKSSIFNYGTNMCLEETLPTSNPLSNTDPILSSPLLVNLLQKNTNYSALGCSKGFIPSKLSLSKSSPPTPIEDLPQNSFGQNIKKTLASDFYLIPTIGVWNSTLTYNVKEEDLKCNLSTFNSIDYPTYTSCSKKMSSLLLSSSNLAYQANTTNSSQNKIIDDPEIYKFPIKSDSYYNNDKKAIFVSTPNSINSYKKAKIDLSILTNTSLGTITSTVSKPPVSAPNRKRKRYPKTSITHENHLKNEATNTISTNLGSSYTYNSQSPSSQTNKKFGSNKKDDHKNSINFSSKYNSNQNQFAASSLSITEIVSQNLAAIKNAMKNVKASIVTTAGNSSNKSSSGHFNHSHNQQKGFSKAITPPVTTMTYPLTTPNTNAIPPYFNKLVTNPYHHINISAAPPIMTPDIYPIVSSNSFSNNPLIHQSLAQPQKQPSSPAIASDSLPSEDRNNFHITNSLMHPFKAMENLKFDDCIILDSITKSGLTFSNPTFISPDSNPINKINGTHASSSKEYLCVANPVYISSLVSYPHACDSIDDNKELNVRNDISDTTPTTPNLITHRQTTTTPPDPRMSSLSANANNTSSERSEQLLCLNALMTSSSPAHYPVPKHSFYLEWPNSTTTTTSPLLPIPSSQNPSSPPSPNPPVPNDHLVNTNYAAAFVVRHRQLLRQQPDYAQAKGGTGPYGKLGGGGIMTNGFNSPPPSSSPQLAPPSYCNDDSPFFQLINPLVLADHHPRPHHALPVERRRCRAQLPPTLNEINTAPMSQLMGSGVVAEDNDISKTNRRHIITDDTVNYNDTSSSYLEEPSIASYFHHDHNNVGLALVDEGLEDDLLAMNDGAGLMDTTDIMMNHDNNHNPPSRYPFLSPPGTALKCEQFSNSMDQQDFILYNISSS